MRVLLSPNAFKNSLSAEAAADAMEMGLRQSALPCEIEKFPVGDGGDGTGALLMKKLGAERIEVEATDPLGRKRQSHFGWVKSQHLAIVEMADASGLRLLKKEELNPTHSSSFGTGELLKAAFEMGARKIILGVGGSATVDGGLGALSALGLTVKDQDGAAAGILPHAFDSWDSFDASALNIIRNKTEIIILCDVKNSLLGNEGAARVFGPQKGATKETLPLLEAALARLHHLVHHSMQLDVGDMPRGGAAGGIAAFLHAFLGAQLVSGIDYFLELTEYDTALASADIVMTGEGSLDRQTLEGKAPLGVAVKAVAKGKPVVGFAGTVEEPGAEFWKPYFSELIAINKAGENLQEAMLHTAGNLADAVCNWGRRLKLENKR